MEKYTTESTQQEETSNLSQELSAEAAHDRGESSDPDTEIYFDPDFNVSDVRKRAISSQKKKLLRAFPHMLLFAAIKFIPPVLLYILAVTKRDDAPTAALAIELMAFIVWPVLIWGPLSLGFTAGCLDIVRGSAFTFKRLFMAFRDKWLFKAIAAYVLYMLVFLASNAICLLPAIVCSLFLTQLSAGFAQMISILIIILLGAAGLLISSQVYLRFIMMFPLLLEYPDMGAAEAAIISLHGLKGFTKGLLLLMLSYAGWFLLFFGIAFVLIIGLALIAYMSTISLLQSGDVNSAFMTFYTSVIAVYAISYLLYTVAYALFIIRPGIGLAAFYDEISGRRDEDINDNDSILDDLNQ